MRACSFPATALALFVVASCGGGQAALATQDAARDVKPQPPTDPTSPAVLTLRGVVRDQHGRPVPWCQVSAQKQHDTTGQDGSFALSDLRPGTSEVSVWILGTPSPAPHAVVQASAGDHRVTVPVNVGDTLVVSARNAQFLPGAGSEFHKPSFPPSEAKLIIAGSKGRESWGPAVVDGSLCFRRVERGRPWSLFIPKSQDVGGTAIASGSSLVPGAMTVVLEEGNETTGVVATSPEGCSFQLLGTGSGPGSSHMVAILGDIYVQGDLETEGEVYLPPLPAGTWRAAAYYIRHVDGTTHYIVAEDYVQPGDVVRLAPRSVPRSEWLKLRADALRWGD